jgi:hypothetical protein
VLIGAQYPLEIVDTFGDLLLLPHPTVAGIPILETQQTSACKLVLAFIEFVGKTMAFITKTKKYQGGSSCQLCNFPTLSNGFVLKITETMPSHASKPQFPLNANWLVVSTPLKNMKVSWDDYSQYMEKTCSKPPISQSWQQIWAL